MDNNRRNKLSGFHLFNLAGFEVRLDPSWFFLAILICWTLAAGYFPFHYPELAQSTYWIMGVLGALGLFLSIILHELCHSLVGRHYGIPIRGITLFIFGGIAHMNDMPPNPKSEFFMAIVGPLFSIFLAGILLMVFELGTNLNWSTAVLGTIQYLSVINFVLGIFNLLPGYPLDGGRVFRSILWWWKGDIKWATNIAGKGGIALGYGLMFFGIIQFVLGALIAGMWMFVLGFFLSRISKMSYQQVVIREMFHDEPVKKYAKTNPVTVEPDISINQLMEDYFYHHYHKLYPVVKNGKLEGCITLNAVKQTKKEHWSSLKVRDVMQTCDEDIIVDADTKVTNVLEMMLSQNINRMMITENNKLYGIITLNDLREMISVRTEFEESGK